jgi:hypothetical protein
MRINYRPIFKSAAFTMADKHYTPILIRIIFLCLHFQYHGRPYNPLVGIFHSLPDNGNSGRVWGRGRKREVKYGREHRKCSTKLFQLIHEPGLPSQYHQDWRKWREHTAEIGFTVPVIIPLCLWRAYKLQFERIFVIFQGERAWHYCDGKEESGWQAILVLLNDASLTE